MRKKKLISVIMFFVLMLLPAASYAGEIAENDYDEIIEESAEIDHDAVDTEENSGEREDDKVVEPFMAALEMYCSRNLIIWKNS